MQRVKRNVDLEQYFTCRRLAAKCIAAVENHFPLASFTMVLEPSAGDGAFYSLLPQANRVGIDLQPLADGIQKADFLRWEPPLFQDNILTIGNPPFGQRGSLAVEFVNRACQFSRVVAFILPRTFRKDTFYNRVDPMFHLVEQFDCDDFRTPVGEKVAVKSVFQIWERKNRIRAAITRDLSHEDFELKHAHLSRVSDEELGNLRADFDFAIAQVGANFTPKDVFEVTKGSYWYVKALKPGVREVFEKLDFDFLDGLNLSFKSLSKKDIIQAYHAAKQA
jgi:predicted RNA methylase